METLFPFVFLWLSQWLIFPLVKFALLFYFYIVFIFCLNYSPNYIHVFLCYVIFYFKNAWFTDTLTNSRTNLLTHFIAGIVLWDTKQCWTLLSPWVWGRVFLGRQHVSMPGTMASIHVSLLASWRIWVRYVISWTLIVGLSLELFKHFI